MNTVKPDAIALFCLTPGGVELAQRLKASLPMRCFTSEKLVIDGFEPFTGGVMHSLREAFHHGYSVVFIGATGIVVRAIAPLVNDKFLDPAVIVIDEHGQHVISLLSGHLGGANALAHHLAGLIGADPVITTATDVNNLAALDMLARELDARMFNFREAVKSINQRLVSGQRVGLWCEQAFYQQLARCDTRGFIAVSDLHAQSQLDALVCVSLCAELPALALPVYKLVPRRVVAGFGCRRDTPMALLATLLEKQLQINGLDPLALRAIGSIDLKQDEKGLQALAQHLDVPFTTFSADALRQHEHHFPTSDFVRQTAGVGSVSGPTAWQMSQGQLIGDTLREQGVTITLGVTH
ncbi:cobalt-precorrin 5A hydrolase [Salmonella enterica]